ncbi:MAG TPA: proline dehydrogenase family protein [Anaerolineales bacterium]|nr:proline dehydrogenase family protein [Anaerolineales bacterium]
MMRSFFIYLSKADWARKIITRWRFAWNLASRFVAGEKLADAIQVIRALNAKGINATLDHLGEHTDSLEASQAAVRDIIEALDAIQTSGVRSNVSIKLTQIGLKIDPKACAENLRAILTHARELGNFIRIDMEEAAMTQVTLDLLMKMRQEGFANVGVVIQSYLYRSEDDVQKLVSRGITVRLCKGAYKEPAEVAYPKKQDVDAAYDRVTESLMKGSMALGAPAISADGRIPPIPCMATHDPQRIQNAKETATRLGLPKDAFEFQMLYGIRRDLQEQLITDGYNVRVYVPYGTEWYPYNMRRLAERPANVWFIFSNFFRR